MKLFSLSSRHMLAYFMAGVESKSENQHSKGTSEPKCLCKNGNHCPQCINDKLRFLKILGEKGIHCPVCLNESDFMERQRYLENSR